uniref:Si:dkeyp-67a8.4 n=1 Tax=Cyprinus carpio TaxID=7962 RepID=A0A8C2FZR5_CYPCA
SSAGNTILNQQVFKSKASPESVTAECVSGDRKVHGKKITVIDTPGLFDTGLNEEAIKSEIIRSVIESSPGPDMFTIVLKVGRYTGKELEVVDKIVEYCGEDTFNHSVVLFTHGEQLEGQTIDEFVKMSPKLQELVDKCGGHCHVIDSIYWKRRQMGYRSNRVQVKNLLETIEQKLKDNQNGCNTNELLQIVEEEIQEEMKNINEDSLSPQEKREEAKKVVHKKLMVKLAGVTTGTLTGAFLGIGVAVASVVTLLKAADVPGVINAGTVAGAVGATGIAAGVAAVKAGIAAAGIGVTGSGIAAAAGVAVGVAALAGAIGGGVTGCKAAEETDSVCDAIKNAAKLNYENAKGVVKKAKIFW